MVLVCPSVHEGFGLPAVEIMACEAPVITSNISSLSEIGDDAVVMLENLLDPEENSRVFE